MNDTGPLTPPGSAAAAELNKKIAGLMGWNKTGDWWHTAQLRSENVLVKILPNFLDDDHLPELIRLANSTMRYWLMESGIDFVEKGGKQWIRVYVVTSKDTRRTGQNLSHTIALAIVAHKEGSPCNAQK